MALPQGLAAAVLASCEARSAKCTVALTLQEPVLSSKWLDSLILSDLTNASILYQKQVFFLKSRSAMPRYEKIKIVAEKAT